MKSREYIENPDPLFQTDRDVDGLEKMIEKEKKLIEEKKKQQAEGIMAKSKPKNKLEAEPKIISGGKAADAPLHYYMLDNPTASKLADEQAIAHAVSSCGLTEAEARALIEGDEPLDAIRASATQKMDYSTFRPEPEE